MALDIIQPMRFEIDLRDGLVQKPQRTQLMKGDKNANRVVIALTDGGKAVDLTGATVTGSFISPVEEAKIPLTGSVNGNEASITLVEECYAEDGFYQLDVELTVGETRRTIVSMTGYVLRKGSGAVIDIGDVIPSVDDIIAQYATMKQVTQETQTAADNANAARDGVNEAKENANAAAEAANEAAQAAEGWANAEMTAETLAQGSAATAEVTTGADGHKIIKLGIPRGDTGLTPQITFDVSTGAAGTDVQIEQSGTPEEPVIHLTIPRGDTGAIDGLDYYEGDPAPLGEASPGDVNSVARGNHVHPMPTAEEVGARPDDWMPEIRKVYDRNGENYAEITVSDNGVGIYDSIHGSRLYFNTNSGLTTVYDADDNVLNRLYGTGYKPTPDDIGALPSDGTAASAAKLKTARTIRTNLASTSTASFDGTANVTPGVTGMLPIANGGTGAATAAAALTKLGALPDYGRGETLWSGSWSSGTITVPNTDNYQLFRIGMSGQGTAVLAVRLSSYIRGIGGYSSATPTINTYHFAATFSGDEWTFVACNSVSHTPSENHGDRNDHVVSSVMGLC